MPWPVAQVHADALSQDFGAVEPDALHLAAQTVWHADAEHDHRDFSRLHGVHVSSDARQRHDRLAPWRDRVLGQIDAWNGNGQQPRQHDGAAPIVHYRDFYGGVFGVGSQRAERYRYSEYPAQDETPCTPAARHSSYFAYFDRIWPEMRLAEHHPYIRSRKGQEAQSLEAAMPDLQLCILQLPYIFGSMPGRAPL